jgi:Holliday junction resolvase RusA-like endonuclease
MSAKLAVSKRQLKAFGLSGRGAAKPPAPRNRPDRPRAACPHLPLPSIAPGVVVAEFEVDGLAIPWRAPEHGEPRDGEPVSRTPAHVKRWKEHVALSAHAAGFGEAAGRPTCCVPVEIEIYFCRKAPRGVAPGTRCGRRPDLDNLTKGFADSISGNVFKKAFVSPATGKTIPARLAPPSPIGRVLLDDNVVTDLRTHKLYWTRSLVWVRVITVTSVNPGPFPFAR